MARIECLVKLFTLYCVLELNTLKVCSAFWFDFKNFQMYFLQHYVFTTAAKVNMLSMLQPSSSFYL